MEVTSAEDLPLVVEKRPDSVVFNIPELRDDVNRQWETRFNDLLNECGCASGRSFILYALPGLVLAFIYLVNFTDLGRYWSLGLFAGGVIRSEEHTSELQSRPHLVCRLLLE